MVRVMLICAALLVAGEVRGETITIDDGQEYRFTAGDLNVDDRLIVEDGAVFLTGVTVGHVEARKLGLRANIIIEAGTRIGDLTLEQRATGIIYDLGTEIDRAFANDARLFVRRGSRVKSLGVSDGGASIFLEGGGIEQASVEPGALVSVKAGGILLSVVGSWEAGTARLVGITGHSDALADRIIPMDDPTRTFALDLPLSNQNRWQIEAIWIAGVESGGDCNPLSGNEPCWVNQTINTVDIDELNLVRNGFGNTSSSINWRRAGDVDYDDDIDLDDLNMVRNHFGENGFWQWTPPAPSTVPEPSALWLFSLGLFVVSTRRRLSRRHSR